MINPSASGWIDKFMGQLGNRKSLAQNSHEFYRAVRDTGFIYGHVVSFNNLDKKETGGWTTEETTKAALLNTLYDVHVLVTNEQDPKAFISRAIAFYKQMAPEGNSLLKKVLPAAARSHQLEEILNERIRTNDNVFSRNFSHILTNALIVMDVLAFRQYLLNNELPGEYLRKLEEAVLTIVSLALKSKNKTTEYDDLLIRLFESSVRYTKFSVIKADDFSRLELGYFQSKSEKNYLLDMAGMAIWTDGAAEQGEIDFLYRLAGELGLDDEIAAESIASFDVFIRKNRKNIPYFNYSNPVKHFYEHAAQSVKLLITRNKNRLIKELSNNGELMLLLTHSTHRSLDEKEKKKVKKQLLEICKTVPSLTIFLLPGGSLLLPLLIKFIPQLLPTVFNENLEENE
ncbi:LETM1-related biofilm-associated protein [uncultured Flavobacterium sp.]|uniref:LETM1-related biofilm-associated protein n=1 Tax=uncultured Flavobacterium sp. TaxID=165435 RepID=UPI0025D07D96|nr:LETM1-related biofilm-associated protein [uncultured Flavobacterium sp.]